MSVHTGDQFILTNPQEHMVAPIGSIIQITRFSPDGQQVGYRYRTTGARGTLPLADLETVFSPMTDPLRPDEFFDTFATRADMHALLKRLST